MAPVVIELSEAMAEMVTVSEPIVIVSPTLKVEVNLV